MTGRPVKKVTPGKRYSLGLKVTAEMKNRIDAEAKATGRTQSQVAELLMEQSFSFVSPRDWFAGQALAGMIAGSQGLQITTTQFAERSWALADAMLAERNKQ